MSVKVSWAPSTHPAIASYNVEVAPAFSGPFVFLANVVHSLVGPNYDIATGTFFYNHAAGTLTNWYRLVSVDTGANESFPSPPIEPTSVSPVFTNTVKVDHNYGSPGALRYQTAAGSPVEQALIRVYTKTSFDQGETDTPLAITMTNSQGNWVNPVSLTTGLTYVIQFAKEGLYGPDSVEVIV